MGCNSSKLDRLPTVSLCRDRNDLLEDALHLSYALADAHVAYMHSLRSFGATLHRFFDRNTDPGEPHIDGSRSKSSPVAMPVLDHSSSSLSSSSSSGSHIRFNSETEDNDTADENPSSALLTQVQNGHDYYNPESLDPFFDKFMSISYMKSQPPQSVSYTLPVYDTYNEDIQSESSPYLSLSSSIPPPLSQYDAFSASKPPPPPPPPPPKSSTWDILNFFDAYDSGYSFPLSNNKVAKVEEKITIMKESRVRGKDRVEVEKPADHVKIGISHAVNSTPLVTRIEKDEVPAKVDSKKKVENDNSAKNKRNGGRDVSETMREVELFFQKASESGEKVLRLLDLAKFRYHHKNGIYQVKTLHAMGTYEPSLSAKVEGRASTEGEVEDGDTASGSGNFSSTLKRMCMWEKKLYNEVKAEEKLRVMYARKCKELKQMSNKGADAGKIDATRATIKALSTKMQIAFQVIDKISMKVNKLMNEELWPWICKLIHGLLDMFKSMEECYRGQYKAVAEAKNLDSILSTLKLDDTDHLQELIHIKLEIQNWTLCFSDWIIVLKSCIKALNGWLMKCLSCELEQTPERMGAPPVFVICNQWSQSLDRLSEREVVEAMKEFSATMNTIYKQHYLKMQQRVAADKEMEKKVKTMERKEQKMRREMKVRDKSAVLRSRGYSTIALSASEITAGNNIHSCLKHMFKAMEKFSAGSLEACEELSTRAKGYPYAKQYSK